LISVDVTVYKNGFHGDTCKTVIVGDTKSSEKLKELMKISYEATWTGIKSCGPNIPFRSIGTVSQPLSLPLISLIFPLISP